MSSENTQSEEWIMNIFEANNLRGGSPWTAAQMYLVQHMLLIMAKKIRMGLGKYKNEIIEKAPIRRVPTTHMVLKIFSVREQLQKTTLLVET